MSGVGEASAIIGIIAFVADVAGKTWRFLSKMKKAPKESFDVAQDLYLVSSICVKVSLILDEKDEVFELAYKTLNKLCKEIDDLNRVGAVEVEKENKKKNKNENEKKTEGPKEPINVTVRERFVWAWNDDQRKYLLGRVQSVKASFLLLLTKDEFKYFKE